MSKFTHDDVLDAALAKSATATRLTILSAQPADFAGIGAVLLGSYVIDGSDFGAATNGDVSGRKRQVAAQSGNNASASGTGNHIGLDDGTTLLHVTTASSVSTNSGQPVATQAFDIEFLDVTP